MPPKKGKGNDNTKAKAAKSKQKVEDKTFGLKNKNKSKKVQEFVKQVENQTSEAARKKQDADAKRKLAEKKAAEAAKLEAAALFNPVVTQKVPFGVDPKSIVCELFRKNLCTKGKKCKFSHDLNIGRKDFKKDLYTDDKSKKEEDTMDNWDEEKLRSVISSKHGNPKTTTDKICKYFIEAVENGKYGWFWVCPNGGAECMYRHSLPPGFVLKTKEQKRLEREALESQKKITLEDFIETERGKLVKATLTPITAESFAKWKEEHKLQRLNAQKEDKSKRVLTGKEFILKKYSDKFFDDDEISADQGTEWDLSQFKEALDEVNDENIKDYGDGSTAFAENQKAPNASTDESSQPAEETVQENNEISSETSANETTAN